MSRIGKKHIILPEGVKVNLVNGVATVTGKNGTLNVNIPSVITLNQEGNEIVLVRQNDSKEQKTIHGTTRALLNSAVIGVSEGFAKELEIIGIGYRARIEGKNLVLKIGYSHEVTIEPLPGVTIEVTNKDGTRLKVSGANKQAVGQIAALIRDVRRPEPYLGKGIKYVDEYIARKEGKRAAAAK